jgi:hypothetical protein
MSLIAHTKEYLLFIYIMLAICSCHSSLATLSVDSAPSLSDAALAPLGLVVEGLSRDGMYVRSTIYYIRLIAIYFNFLLFLAERTLPHPHLKDNEEVIAVGEVFAFDINR